MTDAHLKYIKLHLIPELIAKLDNEELVSYKADHTSGLDGFMSALYTLQLITTTPDGDEKERLLFAKFMKGDNSFRESSKSYVQFANEIFVYDKVLPAYEQLLTSAKDNQVKVADWVPRCYAAKFGYVEGLSQAPSDREAVLVLENLKPHGYSLGPRLYLSRPQLLAMSKPLGQYHALSYALRLRQPGVLERLKNGIVTLPFVYDDDPLAERNNIFRVLYRVAFDRFYDFFDRHIDTNTFDKRSPLNLRLIEQLRRLRENYFAEPHRLLERLRTSIEQDPADRRFAAILHGDYNRNNVLFRHRAGDEDVEAAVDDIKMIDFQELRYGTPAIDLSFFMYFNTTPSIRAFSWEPILEAYHGHMFDMLSRLLKANCETAEELRQAEQDLELYSFAHFQQHFSRYAFYGVMICLHFLPWMLCSEEECSKLSELFETDMLGEEFKKVSIEAGGDEVNMKILEVLRHACQMGYMDNI